MRVRAGRGVPRSCNCELHFIFEPSRKGHAGWRSSTAARLDWQRVRDLASRLTTPLHPDDYLSMINPLWSSRELRGRIEQVVPETEDAATLTIRPGWGWSFEHEAGQYIGIGVAVDRPLPLAVLLPGVRAAQGQGHHHDHRPRDAGGLPLRPPGPGP